MSLAARRRRRQQVAQVLPSRFASIGADGGGGGEGGGILSRSRSRGNACGFVRHIPWDAQVSRSASRAMQKSPAKASWPGVSASCWSVKTEEKSVFFLYVEILGFGKGPLVMSQRAPPWPPRWKTRAEPGGATCLFGFFCPNRASVPAWSWRSLRYFVWKPSTRS